MGGHLKRVQLLSELGAMRGLSVLEYDERLGIRDMYAIVIARLPPCGGQSPDAQAVVADDVVEVGMIERIEGAARGNHHMLCVWQHVLLVGVLAASSRQKHSSRGSVACSHVREYVQHHFAFYSRYSIAVLHNSVSFQVHPMRPQYSRLGAYNHRS